MTELTEASLTKMLEEMRQMMNETCGLLTQQPTKLLIRPADLAELGLTVDDVVNMIKETHECKENRRTTERVLQHQANPEPAHQAVEAGWTRVDQTTN